MGPERVAEPRFLVRELHMVDWHDAPESAKREDVFLLPPRWALQNLRRLAVGQALGFQETGNQEEGSPRSRNHTLLWIQRATATTRRVANEEALLHAMMAEMGSGWQLKVFSDIPPAPTAHEALHLFRSADLVVGLHGSGQANVVFCRPRTGIVDINVPEPHSQYTAHNSFALDFKYRLVMLRGIGLHQSVNITVPIDDVLEALRSLK